MRQGKALQGGTNALKPSHMDPSRLRDRLDVSSALSANEVTRGQGPPRCKFQRLSVLKCTREGERTR